MSSRSHSRQRLLLHLIIHEVRQQHAGSALGVAWAVVQPLMMLGCFFFLFTVLRVGRHYPGGALGQVGIILTGVVPWWFFIKSFSDGISALDAYAPLLKQLNFPIGVLPFATIGTPFLAYVIGLVLLITFSATQGWLGLHALMVLPAAALEVTFVVGLGALLAPLGAMLRDTREMIPLVARLGLWISPVLYLPGIVPHQLRWILYANPLTYFLSLIRYAALGNPFGGRAVLIMSPLDTAAIAVALALLAAGAGFWAWRYVRRVAVDYL